MAGESFSLADIAMTPYANRLDMLDMAPMWEQTRPRVTDWFERIKARPAIKPALLDWCPPDLTADLITFGRQSWPALSGCLRGEVDVASWHLTDARRRGDRITISAAVQNVRFWHKADIARLSSDVCFSG